MIPWVRQTSIPREWLAVRYSSLLWRWEQPFIPAKVPPWSESVLLVSSSRNGVWELCLGIQMSQPPRKENEGGEWVLQSWPEGLGAHPRCRQRTVRVFRGSGFPLSSGSGWPSTKSCLFWVAEVVLASGIRRPGLEPHWPRVTLNKPPHSSSFSADGDNALPSLRIGQMLSWVPTVCTDPST